MTTSKAAAGPHHAHDLAERIIAEYEPIVLRQREILAQAWHDLSISKVQLHLLMILAVHGRLPMSRLAAHLDVSVSNLTGIVDRMSERGLVTRVRDETDRRVVLVEPSRRGLDAVDELEALRRKELRRLLLELEEGDQRACLRAFRALRAAAERLDRGRPTT